MWSRAVLGYILALPLALHSLVGSLGHEQTYAVALDMAVTSSGPVQLFFDSGAGFNQTQSVTLPSQPTGEHEYILALPPGIYRGLRLDPGVGPGSYDIRRISIVRADGVQRAHIPLTQLVVVQQLVVVERSDVRLLLEAPSGSNDPILIYTPRLPLVLMPGSTDLRRLVRGFLVLWVAGILLVWVLERLARPIAPVAQRALGCLGAWGHDHPQGSIFVAAVIATVVATYPVLFLNRSLVAPNNGGARMLYEDPPYVPGSSDSRLEDSRGADIGAMMWQDIPHSHVERESIMHGEAPLWNRYNAAGRPLWGQGIAFMLDPLHWLTLLRAEPALGWDLKFVTHRLVFALGVGLAAFCATGAWLPAAIAAASAPFAGLFTYRLNHPAAFSVTYAPWVLLAWFLLARATDRRQAARAALLLTLASSLLLVASTPKEAAALQLAVHAVGALLIVIGPGSWRERRLRIVAAAVAAVAAVLLTAPHWLMFSHTLRQSFTAYDVPYANLAYARHAVALFFSPVVPRVPYPGLNLVSLVALVALVTAPTTLWRSAAMRHCTIVALGLLAIAFGAVPAETLVRIPLVSQIGHIDDVFISATLPLLLVVSAAGFHVLLTGTRHRAVVVTLLVATTGGWLLTRMIAESSIDALEPWAALLLLILAALVPWTLASASRQGGVAMGTLAAVASLAALLAPGGLQIPTGDSAIDRILAQPRIRAPLDRSSPAVDAIHRVASEPTRVVGLDTVMFPGTQALYELEGIGGADPLEVPAFRELVDAGRIERPWGWVWLTVVRPQHLRALSPLLDMLNVRYTLARAKGASSGGPALNLQGPDTLRAEVRPTAWPRAYVVDGVTTYTDARDLLNQVGKSGPLAAVQIDDETARKATGAFGPPRAAAIAASSYVVTPNTTAFHVRSAGPGVAVLGETFLPDDFRATLNERRVKYFRVNHVFKAVTIPARGEWDVRFEYRPKAWNRSLIMAAVGALLTAVLLTMARTQARATGEGDAGAVRTSPRAPVGATEKTSLPWRRRKTS